MIFLLADKYMMFYDLLVMFDPASVLHAAVPSWLQLSARAGAAVGDRMSSGSSVRSWC